MGIFKESLNPFVEKQLSIRQELIAIHENRSASSVFEPGAWHAYTTNKYCSMRMASCVDITSNELLEMDLELGGVKLEGHYKGAGLARSYILQGGQLLNPRGAKNPVMRRGFPGGGRPLGGVYGDPLARADAKDGYGLVPMPGITKLNIRTKSAYGSLREAKVDFVCHNLRQLAVLEVLYMRPGYPVLIEWGWSPYINNSKKIETDLSYISDLTDFWGLDSSGNTTRAMDQIEIAEEINARKKSSNGNYDSILGLCKNFSYSVRPDGGFNCTTELMAMGEIISSMKGRTMEYFYNSSITDAGNNTRNVTKKQTIPHLLDFLQRTHDYVANVNSGHHTFDTSHHQYDGPDDQLQTEDDEIVAGKYANRSAAYLEPVYRRGNMWITFRDDQLQTYNITRGELELDYKNRYLNNTDFGAKVHLMHFKEGRTNWDMFLTATAGAAATSAGGLYVGTLVAEYVKQYQDSQKGCTEGYIRLDALCYNINKHCINPIPRDMSKRFTCYQTVNYDANSSNKKYRMNTFSLYGKDLVKMTSGLGYKINTEDFKTIDMSTDPYIALMPSQYPDQFLASSNPQSTQFVKPIRNSFGYSGRDFEANSNSYSLWGGCFPTSGATTEESKESIGHIMINLKHLLDIHDDLYGDDGLDSDDYSIGKFMQKVVESLNKVMAGNNKFSLVTSNENPSVTEIVDLNHKPKGEYKDVFIFNVLSNDTIVRNFSYNSAVPSAMAATIAIGAGDPDNAASVDAVTFAAMNRGIKNRIFQASPKKPAAEGSTAEELREAKEQLQQEFNDIRDIVLQLKEFQALTISGEWFATKNAASRERLANIKTSLSKLRDLVNRVSTKDDLGLPLPTQNPTASTPIPIKVDLEIDGISGIIIGQLFRVNESRLPLQYRSKKIIFVCVSEEQNIDENGNWTTKISGQMQLFPSPARTSNASIDVDITHFDPIPYARRFFAALSGTGTDNAEMDALFTQLNASQLKKVEACWDSSPHFNEDNGTPKSLLEWIDADEMLGRYNRWVPFLNKWPGE